MSILHRQNVRLCIRVQAIYCIRLCTFYQLIVTKLTPTSVYNHRPLEIKNILAFQKALRFFRTKAGQWVSCIQATDLLIYSLFSITQKERARVIFLACMFESSQYVYDLQQVEKHYFFYHFREVRQIIRQSRRQQ